MKKKPISMTLSTKSIQDTIKKLEQYRDSLQAKCDLLVSRLAQEGQTVFYTLLAVEFGAGIFYNSKENPKAPELGFGVGTYPGQIHAFEDGWYYWDDKTETWRYTHGIKATMPMYNAEQQIIQQYVKIAREVFGGK